MTRRGLLLFASLGVIWGIPYMLIKVAVEQLSPALVVFGRTSLAAVLLLPIVAYRGEIRAVVRRWKPVLAYTIAEIVLPWYFLSSAEQRLPSSITALLIAAVPLVGVAVAFALGRWERLSRGNWLGILVGMGGVAALVGLDVNGSDLGSVAKVAVVAVGYAVGPAILSHWLSDLPSLGVVAISMLMSAVIYVPIVLATGGFPSAWPSGRIIGSVIALAVVCSATAFAVLAALVAEIGPLRATAITYVNPAIAIVVGAIFLSENITGWTILGFALVLAGSYLVTRRSAAPVVAEPEAVAVAG